MDAHKDPDPYPKKIGPDPQHWFIDLERYVCRENISYISIYICEQYLKKGDF